MRQNYISNIKKRDLLQATKYMWIEYDQIFQNLNFERLLDFIDSYTLEKNKKENEYRFGKAYRRIRKESNRLLGINVGSPYILRTSKHEIKSIFNITQSKLDKKTYIKIPYKISYIFRAIINIVDQIEQENNIELPDPLKETLNITYGMAFYGTHIRVYDAKYRQIYEQHILEPGYKLKVTMHSEFHAANSVFKTIVK